MLKFAACFFNNCPAAMIVDRASGARPWAGSAGNAANRRLPALRKQLMPVALEFWVFCDFPTAVLESECQHCVTRWQVIYRLSHHAPSPHGLSSASFVYRSIPIAVCILLQNDILSGEINNSGRSSPGQWMQMVTVHSTSSCC